MTTPSDTEAVALREAGQLLRFAAEHVNDLDPDLSLAIAEALRAQQDKQWTPAISQRFWTAYARLCNLIKPVTVECLMTADQSVMSRSWIRFWRGRQGCSLAERTSNRYLALLLALLFLSTPLQLYVWVSTSLSKQLESLLQTVTVQLGQLSAATVPLMRPGDFNDAETKLAIRLMEDSKALAAVAERSFYFIDTLSFMSLAHQDAVKPVIPDATSNQFRDWYPYVQELVRVVERQTLRAEGNANLLSSIIASFLLPILFGAIGAVAYVIRAVSDQIRGSTFSKSSPIRHMMRVMLGALMGAVIGLFSSLSAQVTLPPLALAFLAGYGVEAVFSMFDGFVDRFRQPSAAPVK